MPLYAQDPFQNGTYDAHNQDHYRKYEELAGQVSGDVRIFNVARQVEQVYLEDHHCDDIQHGANGLHPRKVQIAEHSHGLHSNDQLAEGDANGQSTVVCSCHVHHGRTSSEDQPTQDKHYDNEETPSLRELTQISSTQTWDLDKNFNTAAAITVLHLALASAALELPTG